MSFSLSKLQTKGRGCDVAGTQALGRMVSAGMPTDTAALLHVRVNCASLKVTAAKRGCLIRLNVCRLSCSLPRARKEIQDAKM